MQTRITTKDGKTEERIVDEWVLNDTGLYGIIDHSVFLRIYNCKSIEVLE